MNVHPLQSFPLNIVFNFRYRDCNIQADQVIIENAEQQCQTIIHFNDLIIDVNKATEVAPPENNTNVVEEGQIRRTFKYKYYQFYSIHLCFLFMKISISSTTKNI